MTCCIDSNRITALIVIYFSVTEKYVLSHMPVFPYTSVPMYSERSTGVPYNPCLLNNMWPHCQETRNVYMKGSEQSPYLRDQFRPSEFPYFNKRTPPLNHLTVGIQEPINRRRIMPYDVPGVQVPWLQVKDPLYFPNGARTNNNTYKQMQVLEYLKKPRFKEKHSSHHKTHHHDALKDVSLKNYGLLNMIEEIILKLDNIDRRTRYTALDVEKAITPTNVGSNSSIGNPELPWFLQMTSVPTDLLDLTSKYNTSSIVEPLSVIENFTVITKLTTIDDMTLPVTLPSTPVTTKNRNKISLTSPDSNMFPYVSTPKPKSKAPQSAISSSVKHYPWNVGRMSLLQLHFVRALAQFDRKLYGVTFEKLTSISPIDRRENSISFVESGLFLYLILLTLSSEVKDQTRTEIDECLKFKASEKEKVQMIENVLHGLPASNNELKFRWSSRLVVNGTAPPASSAAAALNLSIHSFNKTDTPKMLMNTLNRMVEEDSGGAMRDTFEEEELADGARAVLLNTMYMRARWRASPTLLNGTRLFQDSDGTPPRTARMIRINDIMRYANLPHLNAEAVEISYATPGLSLLMLVPRGRSLRKLVGQISNESLAAIIEKMNTVRVAVTLPIYTLRMTLLLPNKLETMGLSKLVDFKKSGNRDDLRLSHAVQRLMFWAEAGRNAFKDDGIEWDEAPEKEVMADRPYIFFVRWRNLTIMNGNFVL